MRNIVIFTMANHSGMGRFAKELANASIQKFDTVFIAPPLENEIKCDKRIVFRGPRSSNNRAKKILNLAMMNFASAYSVIKNTPRNSDFLMIDLYPTVPLSLLPLLAARIKKSKTILNLHDFYPHAYRFPKYINWLEKYFYRYAYRSFDKIVCMNISQIERLHREAGVDLNKITAIEHGAFPVDHIVFPKDHDPVTFLIMGSLRENKNIKETLQAFARLVNEGCDFYLKIAGAPRREEISYWKNCIEMIDTMPTEIKNRISVLDRYIGDDELPSMLSGVDAFICPYAGFDSQSGVSIMAVSNAIPLISTKCAQVAGIDNIVDVAESGDADSIYTSMKEFIATPRDERLQHSIRAREKFNETSLWVEAVGKIFN